MKNMAKESARRRLEMFGATATAFGGDEDKRREWIARNEAIGR